MRLRRLYIASFLTAMQFMQLTSLCELLNGLAPSRAEGELAPTFSSSRVTVRILETFDVACLMLPILVQRLINKHPGVSLVHRFFLIDQLAKQGTEHSRGSLLLFKPRPETIHLGFAAKIKPELSLKHKF